MAAATDLSATERRFTCSDQEYIEQFNLRSLLTDALAIASQAPGKMRPLECLATYFTVVSTDVAASVCHRSFAHVNSTPATRRAFIALFRRSFLEGEAGSSESGLAIACLSAEEVHQLCGLLCADFPFSLVRNAARITANTDSSDGRASSDGGSITQQPLRQFAHKLFVLFLFSEFLNASALAFRALDVDARGRVSRRRFHRRLLGVLDAQRQAQHQAGAREASAVASAAAAAGALFSCPPRQALDDTLLLPSSSPSSSRAPSRASTSDGGDEAEEDKEEEVMFNAFCVRLFAHPLVARALEQQL